MELATVVFLSLVLCGIEDVYAAESLATLTTRVRVVEQDLRAWKFSSIETETKVVNKFKVWEESLKEELTSTFLPSLIKPLVKQAINKIMTDEYIGNEMRGQVLSEVQSLKTRVQITKTQLQALTKDLRRFQRERDTYRESAGKERSELTKDVRALQLQVNRTVVNASYTKMLRTQLNRTIDDLFDANPTLTGLKQDFRTLNASCVVTGNAIESYREGMQEIQIKLPTDIRRLNLQLNQTIDDLFDTNQKLNGLTQDFRKLNTSCVVTGKAIESYQEDLQEIQMKLPSDIRRLNLQLNQTINGLFDANPTLTGLKQDFRTLNASCVVTGNAIESYREGMQEIQIKLPTDIRRLNLQLNQTIDDLFDTNQKLNGLTQDFRKLNTSCVVTGKAIESYQEDLQEIQMKLPSDIRRLNLQLNQTINGLFDTNHIVTGLTQDLRRLNTSCCGMRKEIKEPSTTTYPGTTEASTTDASEDLTPSKTVPPKPVTTQDFDPHATPSAAAGRDLYDASEDGDLERVKRILAAVHVNINYRGGEYGWTPVMAAAYNEHRDVVGFLVGRGADVSLVSRFGNNVLQLACYGGDLDTVKLILSLKVLDINTRGQYSRTPVMAAAWKGQRDVVEFLVGRGADVSLVDKGGDNALHLSCMGGDLDTVTFVVSLGVLDINARDNFGRTAADIARNYRHQRVLDLLLSRGAH
ncbi:uncharacterized protein [Haliotis asinina]|uniref:uncharacterized protein n=1 Tax=Haliotis asinina TaxID=109174 RepID=UPI0035321F12